MSSSVTQYSELLRSLRDDDPNDEGKLHEAGVALFSNPREFAAAAQSILPPTRAGSPDSEPDGAVWKNCIANQVCHPVDISAPLFRDDMVAAVKKAKAKNLNLRAVGSGHSFSDVAVTDGLLLKPQGMNHILAVDASTLNDPSTSNTLFAVESGISIHDLNTQLDKRGLALINMGAYDGQTLAGAISTGTHGGGVTLGPLSSSVRSLILVTEDAKLLQIEPTNGITDPAKFNAKNGEISLVQDDDMFQSNVVAMGCTGLIYAYTLEVMPAYYLEENRTASTWETVKSSLLDPSTGELSPVVTTPRHFEIDVNPYAVDGAHACIVTRRSIHPGPHSGHRSFANWLSGLLAEIPEIRKILVRVFNLIPTLIPHSVNSALNVLVDEKYIDKSFNVLNLGNVNDVKAYAVELSFEATNFVAAIDSLLDLYAQFVKEHKWYQTGPIGIRFVAGADAYLSPQYGRVTCMVELDMLDGIKHGQELLQAIQAKMLLVPGARVHWGLELDTLTGQQAQAMYPKYENWLASYHALNSSGMFNNRFTTRLGISTSRLSGSNA